MLDTETCVYFLLMPNSKRNKEHSIMVRGHQLYKSFSKIHKNTKYIEFQQFMKSNNNDNKKKVIYLLKPILKYVTQIKTENTLFIYDVIDQIYEKKKYIYDICQLSDIIISPNSKVTEDLNKQFPEKDIYTEHHNWDIQFKNFKRTKILNKPVFAISGSLNKFEEKILEIFKERIHNLGHVPSIESLNNVNVMLCFRKKQGSYGKPSTKVAAAAIFDTVFVGTDSYAFKDVLGTDYPYFIPIIKKNNTIADLDNIEKLLDKVEKTYNTKIWNDAVQKMQEVKKESHVDAISQRLYQHIANKYNN